MRVIEREIAYRGRGTELRIYPLAYKVGDEVTYQGKLYRCRQAHTAIVTWEPPNVLALWLPI